MVMSQTFLSTLSTRDFAQTGAWTRFSLLKAVAYIELVVQVRRERRQLARLSSEQLADLGHDAGAVAREIKRGSFDLPKVRAAVVERYTV